MPLCSLMVFILLWWDGNLKCILAYMSLLAWSNLQMTWTGIICNQKRKGSYCNHPTLCWCSARQPSPSVSLNFCLAASHCSSCLGAGTQPAMRQPSYFYIYHCHFFQQDTVTTFLSIIINISLKIWLFIRKWVSKYDYIVYFYFKLTGLLINTVY